MIDSLGDVGAAINSGKPESLAKIYESADLEFRYEPDTNTAELRIRLTGRVNESGVRGETNTALRHTCAMQVSM